MTTTWRAPVDSDHVENVSDVAGASVSDALETLDGGDAIETALAVLTASVVAAQSSANQGIAAAAVVAGLVNDLAAGATVTNAVSGATVDLPVATAPNFPIFVDFTADGFLRLPSLTNSPKNYGYLFLRPPAGAASAGVVGVVPQTGEAIDGRVNGVVYIAGVGSMSGGSTQMRRVTGSWWSGGDAPGTLLNPAGDSTIAPWAGVRIMICPSVTSSHAMPVASTTTMPRGAVLKIVSIDATVKTFNRTTAGLFYGPAGVLAATSFTVSGGATRTVTLVSSAIWMVT